MLCVKRLVVLSSLLNLQIRTSASNPWFDRELIPSGRIEADKPVLVTRSNGRPFSTARKIVFARCCRMTAVGPRYPSFEILIKTSAPSLVSRLRNPWIRRLDADEDSGAMITDRHQCVLVARREVTHDCCYQRASQPLRERHIFAKRHQANLIILRDQPTLFIYEQRRIVGALIRRWFERVEDERSVILTSELCDELLKCLSPA